MSEAATTIPRRRAVIAVTLSSVAGLVLAGTVVSAAADASVGPPTARVIDRPVPHSTAVARVRPRPRPTPTASPTASPTTSPTASPSESLTASPSASPSCAAAELGGQVYCGASLGPLTRGQYPAGSPIVLQGVSVLRTTTATATSPATVTLIALDPQPCPPGKFCGQTIPVVTHTIDWPLAALPAARTAVDLYGLSTGTSITARGFTPSTACYIDYC